MQYMVTGIDGQEYGPVDMVTLKSWVSEGRVTRETMVRDQMTGFVGHAGSVDGLFAPVAIAPPMAAPAQGPVPGQGSYQSGNWAQAPSPYPRAQYPAQGLQSGNGYFWRSLIYAGLGILSFFVLHGIGLIFSGYSIYFGIRCKSAQHPLGILAIGLSVLSFLIVGIGWFYYATGGSIG